MTFLQPLHKSLRMMIGVNINTNDIFTATLYQPKNDDRSKHMSANDILTSALYQPKTDDRKKKKYQ